MSAYDDELEREAAEAAKQAQAKGTPLDRAKRAFHELIETEPDPLKQEKMREFLTYIDKTLDISELKWFQTKAIQTAEAARQLVNRAQTKETLHAVWVKKIATAWAIIIFICVIIILTGFGKVYSYKMPDGSELISESYEGERYRAGKDKVLLTFDHDQYAYRNQPEFRLIIIVVILAISAWASVYKYRFDDSASDA